MNGTNIAFDTCAIVSLIDRQYDLPSLGINIDDTQLLTSIIVRMELLSKRNILCDEEQIIREFLEDLVVLPIEEAIEEKAIEIRRNTNLKLPDCIVAATSIICDAVLLTNDKQLLGLSIPGFRTQNIY